MQKRVVRGPVKSFGPDGILRRNRYSTEDAEVFLRRKMVFAKRNSKGTITQIWFLGDAQYPHMPKFKAGTRYSATEPVGEGRLMWKHTRIARHSHVFFAVLDSIVANRTTPQKVVLIGNFQSHRPALTAV